MSEQKKSKRRSSFRLSPHKELIQQLMRGWVGNGHDLATRIMANFRGARAEVTRTVTNECKVLVVHLSTTGIVKTFSLEGEIVGPDISKQIGAFLKDFAQPNEDTRTTR